MKKHISLSILLCISLVWAVCGTAFATDTEDINTSKITVLYDGTQIPFDVQSVLISGRTMVPFLKNNLSKIKDKVNGSDTYVRLQLGGRYL